MILFETDDHATPLVYSPGLIPRVRPGQKVMFAGTITPVVLRASKRSFSGVAMDLYTMVR